jgi:FlaA1/EpsC-like NDP-sugar epimerase
VGLRPGEKLNEELLNGSKNNGQAIIKSW